MTIDRECALVASCKGDAADEFVGQYPIAHVWTVTKHQVKCAVRHTCLSKQIAGTLSDQRSLRRGLCDDGITNGEIGGDLPDKNSQWEIPRADAQPRTTGTVGKTVGLARYAWKIDVRIHQ